MTGSEELWAEKLIALSQAGWRFDGTKRQGEELLRFNFTSKDRRMNMIQLLFAGRRVRLEELASQIAERALSEVERRLGGSIHTMSSAEARGYVRARAARPVRQQMRFVLASVPALTPEQTEEVLARATDRTVMLVVSEMVKSSRGSKMRRAA